MASPAAHGETEMMGTVPTHREPPGNGLFTSPPALPGSLTSAEYCFWRTPLFLARRVMSTREQQEGSQPNTTSFIFS